MAKGKRVKEKEKSFNINFLFIIFFSCVLVFSIYQIVMWAIDMKKSEEQHQELLNQVLVSVVDENSGNVSGEEVVKVDFEKLLGINEDVVGWLMVDGTNINYPILQSSDNNYYLKRDINRHISKSGSIYMDYRNDGFSDKNTVLYGHNMKNGTMFAELEKIYNGELGNDVKIKVLVLSEVESANSFSDLDGVENVLEDSGVLNDEKIYKVFSTYAINAEAFNLNISVKEALDYTKIDFDIEPKENDKILTLFTCTDTMAQRIIVHAILVDNIELEKDIKQ